MKKLVLPFVFIFSLVSLTYGQSISQCLKTKLKTTEQIQNSHDCILKLANHVLDKPLNQLGSSELEAGAKVLAWMEKSPDYSFSINSDIMKLFKKSNLFLFNAYMAAMAKAALEGGDNWEKKALEYFVNYVEDPANAVKQTGKVKKLIKAWNNGDYEKYLA